MMRHDVIKAAPRASAARKRFNDPDTASSLKETNSHREKKTQSGITIIIPTYKAPALLAECLANLRRRGEDLRRVLIVDDSPEDVACEKIVEQFPGTQLIRTPRNLGFAGACNFGLAQVTTPFVAFLNNDAFPLERWAETLTHELEQDPSLAIICSRIYRKDTQIIDSAGGNIEYPLGEAPPRGYLEHDTGKYDQPADVAYASGTAMVARTKFLHQVGGFDSSYGSYFEETDLAWRLRLHGYKIGYVPSPLTEHLGSATLGRNPAAKTFLHARNRMTTNLKNLGDDHLRHWLLYELVYALLIPLGGLVFPAYRTHALAYLRGLASFMLDLPETLKKRRRIQRSRRVADAELLKLHIRLTIGDLIMRNLRLARAHGEHLFAPE